jgi:hypothetical protein
MNRDTGDVGESVLSFLASDCGIIATPPNRDAYGWDHHLQFKNPSNSVFLDEFESNYTVYIQAKGFEGKYSDYKGRAIKLSNIQHMITNGSPCFFAFIEADSKNTYLVHLGEELIRLGLTKIREAQRDGVELNKTTMTINPHTQNAVLIPIIGASLKSSLLKIINKSPSSYASWKQEFRTNVGFDNGALQIVGDIKNQDFIEVALGLKDSAPVNVKAFTNLRFGIPLPYDELPTSMEILSSEYAESIGLPVNKSVTSVKCYIKNDELSVPTEVHGELSKLPGVDSVCCFSTPFVKFIFYANGTNDIEVTFLWQRMLDSKMTLDTLRHNLQVIKQLLNQTVILEFFVNEEIVTHTYFNEEPCINELKRVDKYLNYCEVFRVIQELLNVKITESIEADLILRTGDYLESFYDYVINKDNAHLKLTGDTLDIDSSKPTLVFLPIPVAFLGKKYIVTFQIEGQFEIKKDAAYCAKGTTKVFNVLQERSNKQVEELKKRMNNVCNAKSTEYNPVISLAALDNQSHKH